jgi:alpha-beta hydrolase superfamily lysophospholipase
MKLARPDSWGAMLATALHPDACVVECEWKHRSRDPRVVERYWTDPLIWTAGLTRRAAKELAAGWHLLRAHASSLRVPLLLLQGGADMLSDPREAHAFYDAAGSAVKMMHIYTGLAHDLLHEPEQESILGDIVSWLEAHM